MRIALDGRGAKARARRGARDGSGAKARAR
jgi:hypothetical protein